LRIYLPLRRRRRHGSRLCAVDGRIAWQRGPAVGIRFTDIDDDTWTQLASFLSTLPQRATEPPPEFVEAAPFIVSEEEL